MKNKSTAYAFGMQTDAQQSMPIHNFNPYLDMRPQNTSDLDYLQ